MPRGGPCAAERRPYAAQRRSLCREEALCAGRSYILRELEEAPVSGGGSSDCAEWFDSSMLRELQEAPVPEGGHPCAGRSPVLKGFKEAPVSGGESLCRMVLLRYAERIEGFI